MKNLKRKKEKKRENPCFFCGSQRCYPDYCIDYQEYEKEKDSEDKE